jgi:hypothetical protein
MIWIWHRYVLRHKVTFHPAIKPSAVIRDENGRPTINVFQQDTFQRPDAHYECSCGEKW